MASSNPPPPPPEGLTDDFLEQILAIPNYHHHHHHDSSSSSACTSHLAGNDGVNLAGNTTSSSSSSSMLLQLNSDHIGSGGGGGGGSYHHQQHQHQYQGGGGGGNLFPLGLSLEQGNKSGFMKPPDDVVSVGSGSGKRFLQEPPDSTKAPPPPPPPGNNERDSSSSVHLTSLFPAFSHVQQQQQQHSVRPPISQQQQQQQQQQQIIHQPFHGQPTPGAVASVPHPPAARPRVRARRGQATDPHSIAERLRRERIAERMKALQELVPSSNKTDRAAMLDEIVDYVKFLRLQVKVLSMSRLGGAGAVAQLVADIPLQSSEGEASEGGGNQLAWEKWSTDGTEQQVAKLMEEDVGAAMQFLQSKALCIMPISLASAIYHTHQTDPSAMIKPEPNAPS